MYGEEYLFERDKAQAIQRAMEAVDKALLSYDDDVKTAAREAIAARLLPGIDLNRAVLEQRLQSSNIYEMQRNRAGLNAPVPQLGGALGFFDSLAR